MVLLPLTLAHGPAGVVKTVFVTLQAYSHYREAQRASVFASEGKDNVRRLGHNPGSRSGFWEVCPVTINAIDALTDETSAERSEVLAANSTTETVGVNILYQAVREVRFTTTWNNMFKYLFNRLAPSLREHYFPDAVLSTEGDDVEIVKALEGEVGIYSKR